MNILLWILQGLAALLYGSSGVMKVFLLDSIREDQPAFDALPDGVWHGLGVLELVCTIALIVPSALRWRPRLTVLAAVALALESLVFVAVHLRYHETGTLIFSAALGLLMAFLAYGRSALQPIASARTAR
jgi:hypothetical protein